MLDTQALRWKFHDGLSSISALEVRLVSPGPAPRLRDKDKELERSGAVLGNNLDGRICLVFSCLEFGQEEISLVGGMGGCWGGLKELYRCWKETSSKTCLKCLCAMFPSGLMRWVHYWLTVELSWLYFFSNITAQQMDDCKF